MNFTSSISIFRSWCWIRSNYDVYSNIHIFVDRASKAVLVGYHVVVNEKGVKCNLSAFLYFLHSFIFIVLVKVERKIRETARRKTKHHITHTRVSIINQSIQCSGGLEGTAFVYQSNGRFSMKQIKSIRYVWVPVETWWFLKYSRLLLGLVPGWPFNWIYNVCFCFCFCCCFLAFQIFCIRRHRHDLLLSRYSCEYFK